MSDRSRPRRVVVTGASRGIGAAVANLLAERGDEVVLVARSEERLSALATRLGSDAMAADIATEAGVTAVAERVRDLWAGVPDALINGAGAFAIAPFAGTDVADFDRQLATNLRGPFLLTRAFLPGMVERRSGHVINVGSIAGRLALPGNAAYSASKYGLRGLHEVLVEELRGTGVRATLLEPAATDTSLWDDVDPDNRDDLPSRSQMLSAEDVARAILFALNQPAGVEVSHLAVRSLQ